jgi:hypothetical protein
MDPPAFIHPGGLQGEEKRNRSEFTFLASRSIGSDISLIVRDRKALHLGIGFAFVVAEHLRRIVARADAGAADVQSHFSGMEKLAKEIGTRGCIETVEGVAGGVGESRAEAEDILKFVGGIQGENVVSGGLARVPG